MVGWVDMKPSKEVPWRTPPKVDEGVSWFPLVPRIPWRRDPQGPMVLNKSLKLLVLNKSLKLLVLNKNLKLLILNKSLKLNSILQGE